MSEYKYQSPIEIIQGEMGVYMDGEILKAVQNVGINVDKDELLKALAYDRDQYNKGYNDGRPKVGTWIRITQGLVVEKYACSVCGRIIEDGESEALLFIKYPYCHCGAKMERRADERKKITIERNICPKPECGDEFPIPKEGWKGASDEMPI